MNRIIFILLLNLPLLTSCKKLIEIDGPIESVTSEKIFDNEENATAALTGIYARMGSLGLRIPIISTGAITISTGLASDELLYTSTATEDMEFGSNEILPTNETVSQYLWRYGYNFIYHTNAVIEGVSLSPNIAEPTKNKLTGEAKFLRAYLNFLLINIFGDIPLITSTDYNISSVAGRSPSDEVYRQIISDLEESKKYLITDYPVAERVRANNMAASALLARVYLYNGNVELAAQNAQYVINSGLYSLNADLNETFISSSNETIWQLMVFAASLATVEGFKFIPSSSLTTLPAYPITPELINSFEPADLRYSSWINNKIVNGITYFFPYKYKKRTNTAGTPVTEYNVLLRLAEMYLIMAESMAKKGNLENSIYYLNILRQRAGLPDLESGLPEAEVLDAIESERRHELFVECGHRWFDLKRTKRADEVLSIMKPGWQSTDTLFPIPKSEILSNPHLIQNEGY